MRNISVSRENAGGKINYEVEKTYPEYKITLTSSVGNNTYNVLEDRKIDWKIYPEKMKIGEFNSQKATASFAGRKWTAWFTTDVPVFDGPYKFYGLPGLIVQISDETGSHKMELKGIKKLTEIQQEENTQVMDIPFTKKKPIEVNRQQYIKQLKQYENDPVQGMREIMGQPNSKIKVNINGQEFTDPKEVLRVLEQNARKEISENNNKIELNP
jgi:GLPGLI family protein